MVENCFSHQTKGGRHRRRQGQRILCRRSKNRSDRKDGDFFYRRERRQRRVGELAVIHAYLDIESLWMGSRLTKDRADHRSGLVEVSNASFFVPTAGGERDAAWNPILAKSRPAMHRGSYKLDLLPSRTLRLTRRQVDVRIRVKNTPIACY